MMKHWYVYIIIAIVTEILALVADRYKIIKNKTLRWIVALFVASIACWLVYDFVIPG